MFGEVIIEAVGGEGLRLNALGSVKINVLGVKINVLGVPCTQFNNTEMQLALYGGEDSKASEFGEMFEFDEDSAPNLLCTIPPRIDWNNKSSDWVLRKEDEIKDCVGVFCDGFEGHIEIIGSHFTR